MKKIKNIVMLSLLAVVLTTTSCSDFLNINKDPNRVTGDNVTPNLIFTQAENAVGRRAALRFVFLNNWMGYWARSGTFAVEQEETSYKATNTFSETNWDNAYDILFDLNQVKTKALAANDSLLAGAAMVLSAKLWQETVDQFGAIPYSQAFNYVTYPQPAYDNASAIYADLLVQLDKAIAYMNQVSPNLTTFGNTDIIFCRGTGTTANVTSWKQLANTIKLRIFLHNAKNAAPTTAQLAKLSTDGGILTTDVSVQPGYSNTTVSSTVTRQNPFYGAYGLTPAGAPATTNNTPNNYFIKIADPTDVRLGKLYSDITKGTDYGALGGNAANPNVTITGAGIGSGLLVSATQDQFILPAYESLFFQAEASARGWNVSTSTTQTLYQNAVTASFNFLGVGSSAAAYLSSTTLSISNWVNAGTTSDSQIKFIAYQKYLANCGVDPLESWTDLRRGTLVLPSGYLSWNATRAASLPNVLPYPQSEWTSNGGSIPTQRNTTTIFTEKLFWQP